MTKKLLSILLATVTLLSVFLLAVPAYAVDTGESGTEEAPLLRITGQPNDMCVALGEFVETSVIAEGEDLTYQWYYKDPSWKRFFPSVCKTQTYKLKMKPEKHGCQVYCVITDQFGNQVKSNTITLSAKVGIVDQPKSAKAHDGSKAKISIGAVGDGLSYKWFYREPSLSYFQKSDSYTKDTYELTMSPKNDGWQVYCRITDQYGNSVKSDVVTISLDESVRIITQPEDTKAKEGETATVSVEAEGDGLTYAWYRKSLTEHTFQEIDSANDRTYNMVMDADDSSVQVFCKVTDEDGNTARSNTVILTKVKTVPVSKIPVLKAGIYTLLVFALLVIALKKRDSKVLFNVIMLLCWIVIVLSMDSYDISNYRFAYDDGLLRGKEPLFDVLQNAFASAKIPFSTFKLIYSTVIWALLYRALKNFTADMALAAIIFVIGPMMGFGTQMRSSLAGVLILNAMPHLLKKDGEVWKYCAWVIAASLMHLMAAFYFVFLIPRYLRWETKKFRNILCILAIVLIPVFSVLVGKGPVAVQGGAKTALDRILVYFSGEMSPNQTGFLFSTCVHLVIFFLTDRVCSAMLQLRSEGRGESSVLSNYAVEYLCKLNSVMILVVPCYVLSMQFDRLLNYFAPVCYCLIAQGTREVLAFKKTEEGATYRIMQAGNSKILRAIEKFIWKIVDSKPVQAIMKGLRRVKLDKFLQTGNIELLVLLLCMIFCFFVGNRYTVDSEFVRIINGIGKFAGPK